MDNDQKPLADVSMAEQVPTPEQEQEERNNRINAFVQEFGELVAKHRVDFAAFPVYTPDGNGGFRTTLQHTPVDVSKQPVKSNFIAQ